MSTTTINIIINNGAAPDPVDLNRAKIHDHLPLTASDSELTHSPTNQLSITMIQRQSCAPWLFLQTCTSL
ncbi:hypothetical protein N24_1917 [Corynebacterium suranareeae]|uniref:Uncharacterized protein n=1 Tax=Corynebacterium suranareeae TaxID=2506452 RepID=A0A160PQC5_9CORY|nr:hypothetical protein [Corynebacterium suranareeae]BAU96179.1 hypothetical protein N24_1917 [Corynebacterium suranareeae]